MSEDPGDSKKPTGPKWYQVLSNWMHILTALSGVTVAGITAAAFFTVSPIYKQQQAIQAAEYFGVHGDMGIFDYNGTRFAPALRPGVDEYLLGLPMLNTGNFPYVFDRKHIVLAVFRDWTPEMAEFPYVSGRLPSVIPVSSTPPEPEIIPEASAFNTTFKVDRASLSPAGYSTLTEEGHACLMYSFGTTPTSVRQATRDLFKEAFSSEIDVFGLNFSNVLNVRHSMLYPRIPGFSCELVSASVLNYTAVVIGRSFGRKAALDFLSQHYEGSSEAVLDNRWFLLCTATSRMALAPFQEQIWKNTPDHDWSQYPTYGGRDSDQPFGFPSDAVCG